MTLGERFIDFRARHNMTQEELAKALGMNTASQIGRIENEQTKTHKARATRLLYALADLEKRMEEETK